MEVLDPQATVRKRTSMAVSVIAVAAAIALLYYGRAFFVTLIIAGMFAFILEPLVLFFIKLRLPRTVASFVVCSIALLTAYLLGLVAFTQLSSLPQDLPAYSQRVNELVDAAAAQLEQVEKTTVELIVPKRFQEREQQIQQSTEARRKRKPAEPPPVQEVRIKPEPTPLINYVYTYLTDFYNVLLMASFVPFLVYFMLSWRDHLRRSFMQFFSAADRPAAGKGFERVAGMVRAYVLGNFILGLILAVASSTLFFFFKLPYWVMLGPVSGFLSLVPYVGVPMAMIPPLVAALAVHNRFPIYLGIAAAVAFLHMLALNLLYPKIVGGRVHLNPLVVTVALMFWGTLWGGIGLVLAIPLTAALKAVCDHVSTLEPYAKLLGD